MTCERHRAAGGPGALCPVCLLEHAIAPASMRDLIVQVPLGHGTRTSVFLVRQEAPASALLRLKMWRRRAPPAFVEAVMALAGRLEDHGDLQIVAPLAACLGAEGWPAVLSPFRRGVPMAQALRSGALDRTAAIALLDSIAATLHRCHAAGLAHGSLVPGNVLVHPDGSAAFLVDFGLAALLGARSGVDAAASDHAGLAALAATIQPSGPLPFTPAT